MKYIVTTYRIIHVIIIILVVLLFTYSAGLAQPEKSNNYRGILLLDDNTTSILGDIYRKNILNNLGLPVYYSRHDSSAFNNYEGIVIESKQYNKDGVAAVQFVLSSSMPGDELLQIEWTLPVEQEDTELHSNTLRSAVEGALYSQRHDIHSGVMNLYTSSNNIKNFEVEYDDSETSSISGYTFDITTYPDSRGKFWRTAGEITALNVIGEIDYYMKLDSNTDDWEYQPTFKGFSQKIADGPEFDANNFSTNVAGHIYSGSLYYTSARTNGYSFFESSLFALGGSLMWEYLGEYKERASTNDMIFTTMGGALLGESLTQTSLFVERNFRQSLTRDVVVFLLSPMRIVNQYLDSRSGNSYRVRINIFTPADEKLYHMARN